MLSDLAAQLYADSSFDCSAAFYSVFAAHYDNALVHEVILHGMRFGTPQWSPPEFITRSLWDQVGMDNAASFFCDAVFCCADLWADIARYLARNERWHELGSFQAMQPKARDGHEQCAPIYLHALMSDHLTEPNIVMRLCQAYVPMNTLEPRHVRRIVHWHGRGFANHASIWLHALDGERLQHVSHELLRMRDAECLLETIWQQRPDALQRAVQAYPQATSPAADLVRPLHQLSDQALRRMLRTWQGRYEWHTEVLRRRWACTMTMCHDITPKTTHELLFVTHQTGLAEGPSSLLVKALSEHPEACAHCSADIAQAVQYYKKRCILELRKYATVLCRYILYGNVLPFLTLDV